jgi:hypothetical protein
LPKGKTPQGRGNKKRKLTFAEEKPCSLGIRVFVGHLMQEFRQLRGATEELKKKRECVMSMADRHQEITITIGGEKFLTTPTSV